MAALAQALLLKLAEPDVKAVITTHYTELKVLAQQTRGFLNASVEFDVARLAPTYRLVMGIPGGSSAIEIAGRLGMDESLLEVARDRLQRDDQALERLLGDLQERQRRVAEEWTRVSALGAEAEQQASEALCAYLKQQNAYCDVMTPESFARISALAIAEAKSKPQITPASAKGPDVKRSKSKKKKTRKRKK